MEDRFYTIDEVAELLGLSSQTIRKLVKEGRIKAIRLGHAYRIPMESIKDLKNEIFKIPKEYNPWV